jgi:ArsR family metal-binding transcriptional regulator
VLAHAGYWRFKPSITNPSLIAFPEKFGFLSDSDYNMTVGDVRKLINDYYFELVEDHHSPGSGRYGVRVSLPADISASFPYLNAVLEDTIYDHENSILIGASNKQRYAFRPHEINLGMVRDPADAASIVDAAVELVNRVWQERNNIMPSFVERKLPPVYELYRLLPRTNCKKCGYPTCLAFAAEIRTGAVPLEQCPLLSQPEYSDSRKQLVALLLPGLAADNINK